MKKILLALVCCIAAAAVGCGGSTPTSSSNRIHFKTVYDGCGLRASQSLPGLSWAVDNQADLDSAWAEYSLDGSAPTIDFDTRTVLATITPGYCVNCCSGGVCCQANSDAEIVSVTLGESCVEVRVEQVEPELIFTCLDTNATAHIVSIPKPSLSICFEANVSYALPCPS